MAGLTPEIIEEMKNQRIFSLATSTKNGIPNVVPVGFLFAGDDNKIWVIDNYFKKTLKNIKENPFVSFYVWHPECKESYQIKGKVEIVSSGPDYEKAVALAHSKKETYPAKNLIKIEVTEIYYVTPGDHAGDLCE